jgi:excisionase family DNA binding protein
MTAPDHNGRPGRLAVDLPPELIEAIAERVVELIADRDRDATADGWLGGAAAAADYLDCGKWRIYDLVSAGRIPVYHEGSRLLFRKSELDAWVKRGGGLRP